ncbi:hypothetical protein ABT282_08335 [Streptomyces sp. NPDC000927]|uniref:hypothetical protein n=1 Tax=Streptomyces sp. NPDC000927 TaxID=3154371 RepID=UPI00331CAA97
MNPRLLTGTDLTAFYNNTHADMLVFFHGEDKGRQFLEGTTFGLLDYSDISSPTFNTPEDLRDEISVLTHNNAFAKILLRRHAITEGDLTSEGHLDPEQADRMAHALNSTTELDQIVAVHEALSAMTAWHKAQMKADQFALRRARAIDKVASLMTQTQAGLALAKKVRSMEDAASGDVEPEGMEGIFLARELNPATNQPEGDLWVFADLREAVQNFKGHGAFDGFGVWAVPEGTSMFEADCDDTWNSPPIYTGRKASTPIDATSERGVEE